jgi:FKBP-type peptidyl-prolyl cis-trans isomerase
MRSRTRSFFLIPALVGLVGGCQEPKEITPVAPPGLEFAKTPPKDSQPAQAIGEQSAAASAKINKVAETASGAPLAPPTPVGRPTKLPSGLVYETLKEGSGAAAQPGQTIVMHYTGTLEDGTKFDSSRDRGEPAQFVIGAGQLIKGWDLGVPGMKVGERRKLTIPGDLGYGPQGQGKIPPNATLTFDIELMGVK